MHIPVIGKFLRFLLTAGIGPQLIQMGGNVAVLLTIAGSVHLHLQNAHIRLIKENSGIDCDLKEQEICIIQKHSFIFAIAILKARRLHKVQLPFQWEVMGVIGGYP